MNITQLLSAIPDVRYVDDEGMVLTLLKAHRDEVRKIYKKVAEFTAEDPLLELCDIDKEFVELMNKYQGKDRIDNPVLDIKVKELKRRSDRAKNKSKDYDVVRNSNAESNLKMYLMTLDRSIANREFSKSMSKRGNESENLVIKIMEIIKNA